MAPWTQSLMGGVRLGLAVLVSPALTLEIRHEKSISARSRYSPVRILQGSSAQICVICCRLRGGLQTLLQRWDRGKFDETSGLSCRTA